MQLVLTCSAHLIEGRKEGRKERKKEGKKEVKMKDQQFQDQFMASPMMSSFETTPERERPSSLSEPHSYCHSPSYSEDSLNFKTNKEDYSMMGDHKKKLGRKAKSFAYRIREHVKMGGPKWSETVKGKLSLGARIIQKGGRENMFRDIFGVDEGEKEKLLKASQCYISTTAGPIAGILFISTHKVAFCSERSIIFPSPTGGDFLKTPYKVLIPVTKIKRANESENVNKPEQKYIEIVTEDDFEFWFMGFVRYQKAIMNLHKALSMSN